MTTLGWVFVLVAGLLLRGMTKGRGLTQLPTDMADLFNAVVSQDGAGVASVLARTGDSQQPTQASPGAMGSGPAPASPGSSAGGTTLLAECKRIGNGKTYRLGGVGPDVFDCSGLVWRAMVNLGMYGGPRFTTYTFATQVGKAVSRAATGNNGDIVVWHGNPEHMGIVDGPNSFYSALNTRSGIVSTSITGLGGNPIFYHFVGANNMVTPDGKAPTLTPGPGGTSVIPGIVIH